VGFVPGLIVSLLMYAVTEWLAGIPIRMTNANFWLVFALSLSMCVFSGLLAMRKTFEADPADLY
jgi:putative ABC transport system permease protein